MVLASPDIESRIASNETVQRTASLFVRRTPLNFLAA
jgi:hypothetical protein